MTVDAVGGVWSYAADLSAALPPLGFEVTLLVLGPPPSDAQRVMLAPSICLVDTGLDLDWLAPDAACVEHAATQIARLCERAGVDLVHLNQPALAAIGAFASPVVSAIHSCVATWWDALHPEAPVPDAFAWQTALVAEGLRRSSAVVAPSRAFAAAVACRYGLANGPLVVWNGRRSLVTKASALSHRVFTAGRLWDRAKNVACLDRVAARLSRPLLAAGPSRSPQGEVAHFASIQAKGVFDEAEMAAILSERPIFVTAARYEPFGLAVLEAAAAGCALVLSDIPTFRELWSDAAVFVAPDDENGFLIALECLLADPAEREAAGDRAKRRAATFSVPRLAAGIAAVYTDVLAGRAAA